MGAAFTQEGQEISRKMGEDRFEQLLFDTDAR
jgi:hypothetical protein